MSPEARVWVEQMLQVPPTVSGESAEPFALLGEELPQILRRSDTARVTAASAKNRDRFMGSFFHLIEVLSSPAQVDSHLLGQIAESGFVAHEGAPISQSCRAGLVEGKDEGRFRDENRIPRKSSR